MSHHDHDDHHDHDKDEKKICVLLSTCAAQDAERLASFLVESGHAACVNIVPQVTSVYRWEGKVHRDAECLLVVKCPRDRAEAVTAALVEAHPYDVPEVIVLKVKGGNAKYLDWVVANARGPESAKGS
jgi:periplasmic divalent cation tolerance protein